VGVLLISGDLEEVLGMSDRIGVMFEGRLVAMLERSDCTPERLGLLMAGESHSTE
jgi:simple sugar transport system ATP-binding protein